MSTQSAQRDPRSIVTPDAFEVSDDLLGMPLATPRSRFAALVIDLMVIGILTVVTRSFALVLGVVAAVFFMRAGFKRTPVKGSVFGRAMRFSVGCLGLFIALFTALIWASCGVDFDRDDPLGGDDPAIVTGAEFMGDAVGTLAALGLFDDLLEDFNDAESIEEAEDEAREIIEIAEESGVETEQIRTLLEAAVPDDADWASDANDLLARLFDEEAEVDSDLADARADVNDMSDEEALDAYLAARAASDDDPAAVARLQALEARLAGVVAGDSLDALTDRIDDLEGTTASQRAAIAAFGNDAEESGGLLATLFDLLDELGFGFGWASLYMTIVMSWWKGQTVGKKMMGIRVRRLDGEPITWWIAFERAGGYAAGFATGLLGFAQVYWDANRQAIHDRIVGTVVVIDDGKKVTDWESAL